MYIIIDHECIDTGQFVCMKLYEDTGTIAFIYKNPGDDTLVELPVTFDDSFQAELFYDDICFSYDTCEDVCICTADACVPRGLLAKMKRRIHIDSNTHKVFDFYDNEEDDAM